MQKYKCHKTVEAGKILDISAVPDGLQITVAVKGYIHGGEQYVVQPEPRFTRARVGEYLVKYQNLDGSVYYSVSPAPEFEAGYTEINEKETDNG